MPRPPKSILVPALCAGTFLGLSAGLARAAEPAPTPPPANWWDTFTIGGTVEAGVTLNGANPGDGLNFGHLFTDKANTPVLNQILVTAQRPLDPKATDYDFGFKVQLMYGSDARYTHFLGEGDYFINELNQFDVVEAWATAHLPWLFAGGIDIKAGQYVTLEGAEVIDPTGDYLYSHSYIFNFGIPFKHTGIMTVSHVDPLVDIYAGVDTGVNTTFGSRGDNNNAAAFHGGIGLNLLDGNLTILATTHIGPEIANTNGTNNTIDNITACGCNPNSALRYLNDITATWKINDSWSLITDANYIRDDGFKAEGYGIAQYAIYTVNDWLKLVGRVEVWRDNNNFFVAAFPGNFDFVNAEHGFLNTAVFAPAPTTYFEITGGLNLSPALPPGTPWLKSITFRPEVRYDTSLNSTTPFDGVNVPGGRGFPGFGAGAKSSQFTFGGDLIAKF
ncbi:MAG: outer membrane beta-barrel protein [Methylocella sp.]|nr:MAG: porin [Hyphomicrobiales bacterium]